MTNNNHKLPIDEEPKQTNGLNLKQNISQQCKLPKRQSNSLINSPIDQPNLQTKLTDRNSIIDFTKESDEKLNNNIFEHHLYCINCIKQDHICSECELYEMKVFNNYNKSSAVSINQKTKKPDIPSSAKIAK
jgi:hypothetical protein